MSDKFDAYGELLGLPAGPRPPDHYTLLGVARTETDEARIHAAARRQVTRLATAISGAHAKYAQQLMGEIATARAVLTTPVVRARYEAQLAERAARPAAVPPAAVEPPPAPAPATEESDVSGMLPPQAIDAAQLANTVVGVPRDPDFELPATPPAAWARPVTTPERSETLAAPRVTARARLVAGPGASFTAPPAPQVSGDVPPVVDASAPNDEDLGLPVAWAEVPVSGPAAHFSPPISLSIASKKRVPVAKQQGSLVVLTIAAGCVLLAGGVFVGAVLVGRGSVAQKEEEPPSPQDVWRETVGKRPPQPEKVVKPTEESAPAKNEPEPLPRPKPPGEKVGAAAGAEMKETTVRPAPFAAAAAPAQADPAQAERVRTALSEARVAIIARDLDRADEQIDMAELDATSATLAGQVEDMRAVRHFVGGCLEAVRKSAQSLKGTDELEVDGDIVGIAEVRLDEDKLFVRRKGESRPYLIPRLPADIAAAVAARWLEPNDPNSKTFLGALLITSPRKEDVRRGREMLSAAQAAGLEGAEAVLRAVGQ